jgi:hypothetical protein
MVSVVAAVASFTVTESLATAASLSPPPAHARRRAIVGSSRCAEGRSTKVMVGTVRGRDNARGEGTTREG